MDENERANRRLVELGYARHEAHVEPNGSAGRASLRGELVAGVDVSVSDLPRLLEMLPPKAYLWLLRHRLDGE